MRISDWIQTCALPIWMNSTPTSGRKMTRERTGQSLIMTSGSEGQVPAHQGDHPNQHREGVMIDVPDLQPPGAYRPAAGQRRYPVRHPPVEHGAVAHQPALQSSPPRPEQRLRGKNG